MTGSGVALSLDTSCPKLLASDFVKMIDDAGLNAWVPTSWPGMALDAEKAMLFMDVEHVRILSCKESVAQQVTRDTWADVLGNADIRCWWL